jgi:hypothetical protein
MTENQSSETVGFMESKFGKTLMVIVSMILVFAGPTYIVYGLAGVLHVNLMASLAVGFALFAVGMVMVFYLVRKKIIS